MFKLFCLIFDSKYFIYLFIYVKMTRRSQI